MVTLVGKSQRQGVLIETSTRSYLPTLFFLRSDEFRRKSIAVGDAYFAAHPGHYVCTLPLCRYPLRWQHLVL